MMHFKIIGLAVSFAPTTLAMMSKASQLTRWFRADLVLIHVGKKDPVKAQTLNKLVNDSGLEQIRVNICWVEGDPAEQILKVCKQEKVDLLMAGALKKENLLNHYLGSVARKIMRKARCSIWMITDPSTEAIPLKNIVVDAEGNHPMHDILQLACTLTSKEKDASLYVVRELKLLGLALSAREQCTEAEYDELQQKMEQEETDLVKKELDMIPHQDIAIHIKLLSGKSGFELAQFARLKYADLLMIHAPQRKFSFLDRIFTHDQEYIFSDLPCNLLIIQSPVKS